MDSNFTRNGFTPAYVNGALDRIMRTSFSSSGFSSAAVTNHHANVLQLSQPHNRPQSRPQTNGTIYSATLGGNFIQSILKKATQPAKLTLEIVKVTHIRDANTIFYRNREMNANYKEVKEAVRVFASKPFNLKPILPEDVMMNQMYLLFVPESDPEYVRVRVIAQGYSTPLSRYQVTMEDVDKGERIEFFPYIHKIYKMSRRLLNSKQTLAGPVRLASVGSWSNRGGHMKRLMITTKLRDLFPSDHICLFEPITVRPSSIINFKDSFHRSMRNGCESKEIDARPEGYFYHRNDKDKSINEDFHRYISDLVAKEEAREFTDGEEEFVKEDEIKWE